MYQGLISKELISRGYSNSEVFYYVNHYMFDILVDMFRIELTDKDAIKHYNDLKSIFKR